MTPAIGSRLGRYEIRSKIGEGGMGEVFLARETSELDRTVALKFVTAEIASDPLRLQRFIQEARTVSALNHPNILTIYEFGQVENTRFLATEFIDGETLRQHLSVRGVKLHQVLEIATQIAAALDAAHEAGVIHRDIKPENIMIRQRDHIVKVLDFGLAKPTQTAQTIDTEAGTQVLINTEPGLIVGTVAYMSPEHSRGEAVDARTDIWSLGVLLYEMLAGRVPFTGKDVHRQIIAIQEQALPPLSQYAEGVPARLEEIIRKALAKQAGERYQTAKDLLIDLRSLRRKLEIDADIERIAPPALKVSPSGRKARIAAGTMVVVLLLIGLGYWVDKRNGSKLRQIESIAVLPFQNSSGNSDLDYLTDGMTESLINTLSRLPDLSVQARSSVFRYKNREVAAQQVASDLSVEGVLNGRIIQHGNELVLYLSLVDARHGNQVWGEQYNRKLTDLLALQHDAVHDVSEQLRPRLTQPERRRLPAPATQNNAAYQAYLRGNYFWNLGPESGYKKSGPYFQQAIDLDPTFAVGYAGLARYYSYGAANGFIPDENWKRAEAAANKALSLDETTAEAYNPLSAVELYYRRNWTGAERNFRKGIALDPKFADIHHHYAMCLVLFGRNEDSYAEIQRALDFEPLSLRFNFSWGRIYFLTRQYDRAIAQFRKTIDLDPNYELAHEWLGNTYLAKGMNREAIAEWSRAATLREEPDDASLLERTNTASGFDAAISALWTARLKRLQDRVHRGEYVSAEQFVTAYMRIGDKDQAFGWLAKAVEERNRFAIEFRINPIYDSLRSDPRFAQIAARVRVE